MTITIRPYRGSKTEYEVDISVQLPSGERIRERKKAPVSTRSGVRRWAEARERELLLNGLSPAPKREVPTLADFETGYFEYCRAERQKDSTITLKQSIFKTWLIPMLGNRKLDAIDNDGLKTLKTGLASRSRKHSNNVVGTLGAVLHAAIHLKVISAMPCEIKMLKIPKDERPFFEFSEYARLIEAAKEIDRCIHLAVLLGADAGLRVGEMVALEQQDIDFRRGYILIQRREYRGVVDTPKSGSGRRVPMTERLQAALKEHRHLRGPRVLYRADGSTWTGRLIAIWLGKAERKAGLPVRQNPHMLRHTFCSHLAMRGVPARTIQELAGHADMQTTLRYMHLAVGAASTAIRLLEQPSMECGDGRGEGLETVSSSKTK